MSCFSCCIITKSQSDNFITTLGQRYAEEWPEKTIKPSNVLKKIDILEVDQDKETALAIMEDKVLPNEICSATPLFKKATNESFEDPQNLDTCYEIYIADLENLKMSVADLPQIVSRLESITTRLEAVAKNAGGNAGTTIPEVASVVVKAFDEILEGPFQQYIALSQQIGGDVKTHADLVTKAFKGQRDFLLQVSRLKQPAQNVLMSMLQPTSSQIQSIQDFRERNRASTYFNHLSAISESIPALGWVTVAPTPAPYVKEMIDAGQFYTNRVLKDYKDKDKAHVDWTKVWIQTLTELQVYVKKHHTTGLVWNVAGTDATAASAVLGRVPPPPGAPPPPPPPVDLIDDNKLGGSDARAALFQEINRGEDIAKGLRKVTPEQQTHKNSNLRLGARPFTPKPYKPFSQPPIAPKPNTTITNKPQKLELQGKKWVVEHHKDNSGIEITDTSMNQAVYIFQCINCTIQVRGKVNSITLDNCKKTSILFDSIVSTVDFINCQRVQAQVTGRVPTISIEKCDGAQIYLSKESLQAEIISSKSSEMNILIPNESGEYIELPVPELYKTVWNGKQLFTEPVEQKG